MQRVCAVRHTNRIFYFPHINKHLFKFSVFRTSRNPARLDCIISCLSLTLVKVQIEQRNVISHNCKFYCLLFVVCFFFLIKMPTFGEIVVYLFCRDSCYCALGGDVFCNNSSSTYYRIVANYNITN